MSEPTQWRVEVYERRDGSSPVIEFIEKQSVHNQAKIFAEFDDLAEFGLMPRGNKLKQLEGKLWELRFRGEDLQFRFIYFVQAGRKIVILHGFRKKTPKTPKRELEIAVRRQYDFLDRYGL
jgi:phage-related protein